MGKKGIASKRGTGEIYPEPKKERVLVLMTSRGRILLDQLATSYGLSRSEFLERIARRQFVVFPKDFRRLFFNSRKRP